MISSATILLLAAIGLLVGVFMGGIGIGGVLLVPSLTYIGGIDIHVAIAACMFTYLFTGFLGAVLYARRGSIRWPMMGWLCAGAMPGAFAGAATVSATPGWILELLIAALVIFAGLQALGKEKAGAELGETMGGAGLAVIGAVTGFGSAMSGTGGPLILVPIMVWLKMPVLVAVGLSQAIQIPVAALATIGNIRYGQVDYVLGIGIAVVLMIGVAVGVRIAHALPATRLKTIVAVVLIGVGIMIVARIAVRTLA